MNPIADRMLVAGVGLIGGSLALAARDAGLVREVIGYGRTPENLRNALRRGVIDRVASTPADALRGVGLVLLAVPVGAVAQTVTSFRAAAEPGAILTDAGSVKGSVVAAMESTWDGIGPVVGAHPIAGSEEFGAEAARADLFRGRRCVLTPTARTDPAALSRVRALWEGVGATVIELSPEVHDAILSRVSHLPHLVAYALVSAVADARLDVTDVLAHAGSGFRDATRIAASRAELWRDIALANRSEVIAALQEFTAALCAISSALEAGDGAELERLLARAATVRRSLGSAA